MVEKMILTDEGYLKGRAIATNVGVFPYLMEDGSVQYELRPPEEVFHPDSVQTLKGLVMTNDHPSVAVTAENSKELSVGFTGDVRQDQYHLSPAITVTDKQAVEDVQEGKKALSCGYTLNLEMTSGNWMGVHYDVIQRKIRYNHLAIVPKGRAGDAAKMKLDSMDSVGIQKIENIKDRRTSSMKITVDGITYEVEDANFVKLYQDTAKELEVLKADAVTKSTELDKATTDLAELNAKADTLKDDNDKLKGEKETLEKADHSKEIAEAVKSRIDLERTAEKAGVEIKEDSSNDDLKKAVILTVYPNTKEKLDSCDSVYLHARYDGAMESIDSASGNEAFTGDTLHSDEKPKGKTEHKDGAGKDTPRTAAQARADMINRSKKASERKED
ncbi:DUF2213 domain-containing protein [bacterium]|nr:DUF2213 domain-containing protein [bacterium]